VPGNLDESGRVDNVKRMTTQTETQQRSRGILNRINAGIEPWVFYPAAVIVVGFVTWTYFQPDAAAGLFTDVNSNIIGGLGWYYVLIVAMFVAFSLYIALSRFGRIKLSQDHEEPEFSVMSWFSMLFAAGMGIGLVFWGVAEPLYHFAYPRPSAAGLVDEELAEQAINQSYMHWGLHPWAIYVVVGVAVAYTVHRLRKPMSIRWALEPIFGDRVKGALGNVIDVTAVVGTLFGVATSLGLGVSQMASGLEAIELLNEPGDMALVVLIGIITLIAILSLVSGVRRGIKWLSNINLGVAAALMLFVAIVGPTLFILREFVQSIGMYLQNIIVLSFDVGAFYGETGESWQSAWTIFYWGWWISWAPFVGVFIARISKGRTVRQFVAGVLGVPTILTFMWFSVLGGTALYNEINGNGGLISPEGEIDSTMSLFTLLGTLPAGTVVSAGVIILIALFFITSSDSGSLVVSLLTSSGEGDPPIWVRIFWGVVEGLVAAALLIAGGLGALQTASIIAALPFSIVMLLMMWALIKAFNKEHDRYEVEDRQEFVEHVGDHYGLDRVDPLVKVKKKRERKPK
jgi:choline/glycine/proline betaine transport protein